MPKNREQEQRDLRILQNSIERVINTTKKTLNIVVAERLMKNEMDAEEADIALQDWEEFGQLTATLWNEERNRIHKRTL